MTVVALFGAGGKMGMRLGRNLARSRFETRHVEISPVGRERIREAFGVACIEPDAAITGAEVVILAVPDTAVGAVAAGLVPKLAAGTIVVILDAAAPHAGHLPERADITYFVTHPCHPPIFNDETDEAARADHFGGIAAKQHIVSALMQGSEAHYAVGEEVARAIWAPVMRSHRVTVEQMAILVGALTGLVATQLFEKVWALFTDADPADPDDREAGWVEVVAAAMISGAIFGGVRAVIQRGGAKGFERATGVWPGDEQPQD